MGGEEGNKKEGVAGLQIWLIGSDWLTMYPFRFSCCRHTRQARYSRRGPQHTRAHHVYLVMSQVSAKSVINSATRLTNPHPILVFSSFDHRAQPLFLFTMSLAQEAPTNRRGPSQHRCEARGYLKARLTTLSQILNWTEEEQHLLVYLFFSNNHCSLRGTIYFVLV